MIGLLGLFPFFVTGTANYAPVKTAHAAMPFKIGEVCPLQKPPVISLSFAPRAMRLNAGLGSDDLAARHQDGHSPYPEGINKWTGGLMNGQVGLRHDIEFQQNRGCLYIERIRVDLLLAPDLYVAKDVQDNHCLFAEILKHEIAHAEADRRTTYQALTQMEHWLREITRQPRDYMTQTRQPDSALSQSRAQKEAEIRQALGVLFESMMERRAFQLAAQDTLAEYARVMRACAG